MTIRLTLNCWLLFSLFFVGFDKRIRIVSCKKICFIYCRLSVTISPIYYFIASAIESSTNTLVCASDDVLLSPTDDLWLLRTVNQKFCWYSCKICIAVKLQRMLQSPSSSNRNRFRVRIYEYS